MTHCTYCGKLTTNSKHSCRTMRGQIAIAPHHDNLMQLIGVDRTPIYRVAQTSPDWAGEQLKYNTIRTWCELNNIPVPTLKEANGSIGAKQRRKQAFINKYGVDNPSKAQSVKLKKDQTNLLRYGVTNPFQRDEVKLKSEQTLVNKYGVSNARYIPRTHEDGTGRLSGPHKKVSAYLEQLGIIHLNEQQNLFPKPRAKNNRIYSPIVDIWIPDIRMVVEIYGDRWHANPEVYVESDLLPLWDGNLTAKQIWDKDNARLDHIRSFGVEVYVIWESELNKNFDTTVNQLYAAIHNRRINQ